MSTNLSHSLLAEMAVFVEVVESGSFSAAARRLGASPSAISRSVARLEQALALRLLHRTTRKLRLSEAGEEVLLHCRSMLAAADAVMAVNGQGAAEPEGAIGVSVPKAVGRFVLHPHMPEFLRRYPKVDVRLRLEDRYMDLIDDRV
ncbi:HTH-type transcriptional regulator DmlR [Serratia ficaria]|nr:HTH-type transcriptional regulator DmlR [Serratia ficaria]